MAADHEAAIGRFLLDEAELLDTGRFEAWLDLFAEDGVYWVPAAPDQVDPLEHVSLFYEDRALMATRIRRLRHPHILSQTPPSRTSHVLSASRLQDAPDAPDLVVCTRFLMLEHRAEDQRLFGGLYTHRLSVTADGYRVRLKRVDLVNCDAPFEALQVFI